MIPDSKDTPSPTSPADEVTATEHPVETDETTPDGSPVEADEAAPAVVSVEAKVEALLFTAEIPLAARRLAYIAASTKREILEAIDRLNVFYGETGRAFRISPIADGFQLTTVSEHGEMLSKLHKERVPTRLSRAALETLSIIAFKQPATRVEIDAIRGVSASDRVLRNLMDRKLVRISGRAEAPGRPLLYGTTREFLAYFGLSSVSDLPRSDELSSLLAGEIPESDSVPEDPDAAGSTDEAENAIDVDEVPPQRAEAVTIETGETGTPLSHSGEELDAGEDIPET